MAIPLIGGVLGNAADYVGTALGLPEMGISENLAGGNTANTQAYQQRAAATNQVNPQQLNQAITNPTGTGTQLGATTNNQNTSTNTNTNSGGSGGGPGYSPTFAGQTVQNGSGTYQSQMQNGTLRWVQQSQDAAAQAAAAQIQATTNMYNNLRAQLESQRPVIDNAYQTGQADLNNQLQLGQQQANASTQQLTGAYNAGMGQLGQQYQSDQAQNRELARAVGGNGSDYAMLQNKTGNAYQNNQFNTYNDYQSRIGQINQGLQSLQQWGAAQQHQLATQYNQSIGQLVLNENMTDFSKADAIQKIQSDYTNQLANINNVVTQFGNQLQLAKAQVDQTALMFGKSLQGYSPLSDIANMYYGSVGTQAPSLDAIGGISYPTQNKTAGGINNNNAIGAASY